MRKVILIGAVMLAALEARADDRCRQLEQLASVAHTFTAVQQRQARAWYNSNCRGNAQARSSLDRGR